MRVRLALLGLLMSVLAGCASIPSEAPELSQALGQRLRALENANITLLQRYFDLKRREVDHFIDETFVPEFARRIFNRRDVAAEWRRIVESDSEAERVRFLVDAGPALQQEINRMRVELVAPLDELERLIRRSIEREYDEAAAINNTLTSFLWSAAEVAENRDRFLEAAGVTEDRVYGVIDGVDSAVSSLRAGVDDAAEYLRRIEAAKAIITGTEPNE
ncbi:hypothetical protein [Candidatus Palauibacter sp.]|uniref:hypothetical protein n=1 Tax=Candidatus Palauibacter sp. TaxID=3101350 RepID=UPI003B0191AD